MDDDELQAAADAELDGLPISREMFDRIESHVAGGHVRAEEALPAVIAAAVKLERLIRSL